MKEKITSRRFWLSVAAFIAGIAGVIAGLSIDNNVLTIIGAVCTAVATCIYNICEAVVDTAKAEETVVVEEIEEDTDDDEEEIEFEEEEEEETEDVE